MISKNIFFLQKQSCLYKEAKTEKINYGKNKITSITTVTFVESKTLIDEAQQRRKRGTEEVE